MQSRRNYWWYLLLVLHGILVVYPMFWLLSTSFKDSWGIFKSPWTLPEEVRWGERVPLNYENAWTKGELGPKFLNSVIVSFTSLAALLAIGSMAAYVLGRFAFRGNRALYFLFLGGMALPAFLGIVPLSLMLGRFNGLLASLDLPQTLWESESGYGLHLAHLGILGVYVAYSLPFTVFVLTGFFRTLPHELAEAAIVDGASPYTIFWRIMLPLAKPGMVTAGTFVFIGLWNEYPLAFVLLANDRLHTLPLGIANLTMTQKYQSDWGALFAGLAIIVIPTIVIYTAFQRQIQAGLTAGAVKG